MLQLKVIKQVPQEILALGKCVFRLRKAKPKLCFRLKYKCSLCPQPDFLPLLSPVQYLEFAEVNSEGTAKNIQGF